MNTQAQLNLAKDQHQQGNLSLAQQLYLQILQAEPANFAAHHLLGVLRSQQGQSDEALALVGRAVEINPSDFGALATYGPLLMSAGRFAEALSAFERALAIRPDNPQTLYNRGLALAMLKRFEEALASYHRALVLRPDYAEAWTSHGLALAMMRRFEEALASYDKALVLQPHFAKAWINRGLALANLKRFEEALSSYDKAIPGHTDDAEAYYNRGVTLFEMGQFEDAIESYNKSLAVQPDFAAALEKRGLAQSNVSRFKDALTSYDKSIAIQPNDAVVWNNRGVILRFLGRFEDSLASCERALLLQPGFADALANHGHVLRKLARYQEALASFDEAIALDPNNAVLWNSRGTLLIDMKRFDDGVASYDRAIALNPDYVKALTNRGCILWSEWKRYDAAVVDLERALAIAPDYAYARGELMHIKMYCADWKNFDREKILIDNAMRQGRLAMRPFAYQALSESPADLLNCSRLFAGLYPVAPGAKTSVACQHEKIRIGYVSADFREHPTAYLMAGLYESHDKSRFEIIAFDNGGDDKSPIRRRLEAAFDRFVDISHLSDREAADKIQGHEIDILVNLNGYFGQSRMGIFAHRPASIQVNHLGFPGTLGAAYMDYLIADRTVIPEEEREFYCEEVVYLPDCYQANDSKRAIAQTTPSRTDCGLPESGFVFCNFNMSYKLTPRSFAGWLRILQQVSGSVLWLLEYHPRFSQNLRREAEAQGIAAARLVFAPFTGAAAHLARLKLADLFLDSLPYNAHTTASDALWAGLPILTCRGTTFPGRVAASLLEAAGLPELVTETPHAYEQLAVALAKDAPRLAALRQRLSQNRDRCVLFDTQRFRRHIEAAYTTIWDISQRGEKPRSFGVQPILSP